MGSGGGRKGGFFGGRRISEILSTYPMWLGYLVEESVAATLHMRMEERGRCNQVSKVHDLLQPRNMRSPFPLALTVDYLVY
jgi:hypothetical protein